jgi:hypothetical protein
MDNILNFSNPKIVLKKAKKIYGKSTIIFLSDKPKKKYMILNPYTNKFIYFGQMGYQDFTKTGDEIKRNNYLNRTANMRGNWKSNLYSPNNLSRNLLW